MARSHRLAIILTLGLLALAMGAVLMAGCGASTETTTTVVPSTTSLTEATTTTVAQTSSTVAEKTVRVAFLAAATANPYADAITAGVNKAVSEMNATVEVFGADFDPNKQITQVKDAITSKRFDAFVIFAADNAALAPAVEEAIAAGIQVSAACFPVGPTLTAEPQIEGIAGGGVVSAEKNGEAMGALVLAAAKTIDKPKVKVIVILGMKALPTEEYRVGVAKAMIAAQNPNIEFVGELEGQYLPDPSYTATQNLLVAHPDADIIWTVGDQMAVGAERAVKEAGLEGKILILGDGGSELGVAAVKEGRWFGTTSTLPFSDGYNAATIAINAARGDVLGKNVDSVALSKWGYVLTIDNIGDYVAEWAG